MPLGLWLMLMMLSRLVMARERKLRGREPESIAEVRLDYLVYWVP